MLLLSSWSQGLLLMGSRGDGDCVLGNSEVPQTDLWGSPPWSPHAAVQQVCRVALLSRCTTSFRYHPQGYWWDVWDTPAWKMQKYVCPWSLRWRRERHWRKEFHLLWKRFKIQNFIAKISQFLPPPHPRILMLGVEWKSKLSKWLQKHCLAEKSNFIPKLCLTEKCILTLVWRLAVPSHMYLSAYTFPLRNKREKDEQSLDLSPGKNTTVCCWCTSVQTSPAFGEEGRKMETLPLEIDNDLSVSRDLLLHRGLENEPKGIIKSSETCNS